MQALVPRRLLLQVCALAFGLLMISCAGAGRGAAWVNHPVYLRVGMRAEPAKKGNSSHAYSTNQLAPAKHFAPGTRFTARSVSGKGLELVAEDGSIFKVEFAPRYHAGMKFDDWRERQFSLTPLEMPDTITEKERAAIKDGRYEVGMSRAALFLSIGYPPATLSPTLTDSRLKYQVTKFHTAVFSFDSDDRLYEIKD